MSFILDALKKSETDRQRQNGPALFEVKVAPPRHGLPLWAVGLGVLLAVNLIIVAWVLLRRPAQADANAAQGQASQAGSDRRGGQGPQGSGAWQGGQSGGGVWQGGQPGQGSSGQGWQGQPGQGGGQNAQSWQGGGQPGQQGGQNAPNWQGGGQAGQQGGQGQSWQGGAPGQGGQNWQGTAPGQGAWQGGGQPGQGAQPWGGQQGPGGGYPSQPGAMGPSGTVAGGPGGALQGQQPGDTPNPDDYAPATDPPSGAPLGSRVARGTASGVPLYQDAALQTKLPELRLDLHVFAALPQNRFVMINMHKLREGDSLPEGVRVESIIPEGAVLSKDGTRFLLPRQ